LTTCGIDRDFKLKKSNIHTVLVGGFMHGPDAFSWCNN
jgi:hypothetical protein